MTAGRVWCRFDVVGPDGRALASCVLEGGGAPDLAVLDHLARMALQAARLGGRISLTEIAPPMRQLLELSGLRAELEGEPELGEEALGIEEVKEEVHPGDLPV